MTNVELRVRVLLSMQRALLGNVTLSMRAIAVSWTASSVAFRVLFDQSPSPLEREIASVIETEVMADLPEHHVRGEAVVVAPAPMRILLSEGETLVFSRAD